MKKGYAAAPKSDMTWIKRTSFKVTGSAPSLSEHRVHAAHLKCLGRVKISLPGHARQTSGLTGKAVETCHNADAPGSPWPRMPPLERDLCRAAAGCDYPKIIVRP
jgi:hypothetical protein